MRTTCLQCTSLRASSKECFSCRLDPRSNRRDEVVTIWSADRVSLHLERRQRSAVLHPTVPCRRTVAHQVLAATLRIRETLSLTNKSKTILSHLAINNYLSFVFLTSSSCFQLSRSAQCWQHGRTLGATGYGGNGEGEATSGHDARHHASVVSRVLSSVWRSNRRRRR